MNADAIQPYNAARGVHSAAGKKSSTRRLLFGRHGAARLFSGWRGVRFRRNLSLQSPVGIPQFDIYGILRRGRRGVSKGITVSPVPCVPVWLAACQLHRSGHHPSFIWLALLDTCSVDGTVSFLHDSLLDIWLAPTLA